MSTTSEELVNKSLVKHWAAWAVIGLVGPGT